MIHRSHPVSWSTAPLLPTGLQAAGNTCSLPVIIPHSASGPLHRRGGRFLNLRIKFHLLSLLKMYLEGKRQYFMCSFCVFTRGPCYLLPLDRFWGEQSRQPPCSFAFLRQSREREHGTFFESYMNLFGFLFCFSRLVALTLKTTETSVFRK